MDRSIRPIGWIRATDNPSYSLYKPRSEHVASSSVKRLALQDRQTNYQSPREYQGASKSKRPLSNVPDSLCQRKKARPSRSSPSPVQTTLSSFTNTKPLVDATKSDDQAAAPRDKENMAAVLTSTSRRPKTVDMPFPSPENDDDVHHRAQELLRSGRFGSVPRFVQPSPSIAQPSNASQARRQSPLKPTQPPSTSLQESAETVSEPEIRAATDLQQTRRPRAEPHLSMTSPRKNVDALDMEETPYMYESLSRFEPFSWQLRAPDFMAQYQKKAGMSEEEVRKGERRRMQEKIAATHKRLQTLSDSEIDAADDQQEHACPSADAGRSGAPQHVGRRQVLGPTATETPATLQIEPSHVGMPKRRPQASNGNSTPRRPDAASPRQFKPLSQQVQPSFQHESEPCEPKYVTRFPRTKRRIYALETQMRANPSTRRLSDLSVPSQPPQEESLEQSTTPERSRSSDRKPNALNKRQHDGMHASGSSGPPAGKGKEGLDDSQATQPLPWNGASDDDRPGGEGDAARDGDETQPLAWEADEKGSESAGERQCARAVSVQSDFVPTSDDEERRQLERSPLMKALFSKRKPQLLDATPSRPRSSRVQLSSPSEKNESRRTHPVTLASPAGSSKFDTILSALHQTRKEEAKSESDSSNGDKQSDLTQFGFSLPNPKRRPSSSKKKIASSAPQLGLDLQDELSDDDTQPLPFESEDEGGDDVTDPRQLEAALASQRTNESETLPLSLEVRMLAERVAKEQPVETQEDGDKTITTARTPSSSPPSCSSSSVPSSSQSSKGWLPGESMRGADEAAVRFIEGLDI